MRFGRKTLAELIKGKSADELEQLLRGFVKNENTIPFDYNFRDEGPASGFGHVLRRASRQTRKKVYVPASHIATELVENYLSDELNIEEFAKLAETFNEMFLWGNDPDLVKVDRKKLMAAIEKLPEVGWPATKCGGHCPAHTSDRVLSAILAHNQKGCTQKEKEELIRFWKAHDHFFGLVMLDESRTSEWYEDAKWAAMWSHDFFLENEGLDKKYDIILVTRGEKMKLDKAKKSYAEGRTDELLDLRNLPGGLERVVSDITRFISDKTFDVGSKGVIGISGGVDSALAAALAVRTLGAENVYGLVLPSATTTPEETKDAIAQAENLGIKYSVIDIQRIVDAYKAAGVSDKPWGEGKPSTLGNAKPRIRMTLLYAWANENGGLVIGTDNKTEGTDFGMGYFTKYGDGGVDINPIGGLYKTQVWQLAKHLGVLQSIIDRKPTAGLFLGQTDEGELGIAYRTLDKVLLGFELGMPHDIISKVAGVPEKKVAEVLAYRMKNQHKGAVPPSVTVVNYES